MCSVFLAPLASFILNCALDVIYTVFFCLGLMLILPTGFVLSFACSLSTLGTFPYRTQAHSIFFISVFSAFKHLSSYCGFCFFLAICTFWQVAFAVFLLFGTFFSTCNTQLHHCYFYIQESKMFISSVHTGKELGN